MTVTKTPVDASAIVLLAEYDARFDVSCAEEHGRVSILRDESSPNPFQTNKFMTHILKRCEQLSFDSQRDFVLLTGGANVVPLVIAILMYKYKHLRVLLFDSKQRRYYERKIG